jgi:hypothetical protein
VKYTTIFYLKLKKNVDMAWAKVRLISVLVILWMEAKLEGTKGRDSCTNPARTGWRAQIGI